MTSLPSVAVVVPVRNGGALVERCLSGVAEEARGVGAELIVVDDGSTDDTTQVAARYATVLHTERPSGPYAARNLGWRSTAAEVLVFTDVRCRPRAGWLRRLVEGLEDPEVAIVGGDTLFEDGPRLASTYLHAAQPFAAEVWAEHAVLPFVPTCNMAVRRGVLESVGGFREVRSGGDVRLSWDAQVRGLGAIAYSSEALMDARGRDRPLALARQWWRYGAEAPRIRNEYGALRPDSAPGLRGGPPAVRALPRGRWGPVLRLTRLLLAGSYTAGLLTSRLRLGRDRMRRRSGQSGQEAP